VKAEKNACIVPYEVEPERENPYRVREAGIQKIQVPSTGSSVLNLTAFLACGVSNMLFRGEASGEPVIDVGAEDDLV
jgi:hypothetical protein